MAGSAIGAEAGLFSVGQHVNTGGGGPYISGQGTYSLPGTGKPPYPVETVLLVGLVILEIAVYGALRVVFRKYHGG